MKTSQMENTEYKNSVENFCVTLKMTALFSAHFVNQFHTHRWSGDVGNSYQILHPFVIRPNALLRTKFAATFDWPQRPVPTIPAHFEFNAPLRRSLWQWLPICNCSPLWPPYRISPFTFIMFRWIDFAEQQKTQRSHLQPWIKNYIWRIKFGIFVDRRHTSSGVHLELQYPIHRGMKCKLPVMFCHRSFAIFDADQMTICSVDTFDPRAFFLTKQTTIIYVI